MHLVDRVTNLAEIVAEATKTRPGFSEVIARGAAELRIEGTSATDPGPDFCRYSLIAADGRILDQADVPGW